MKKDTRKCPSCDKTISIKAKRCPYCRQDLRNWFRRHPILTVLLVLITSPFWIAAITGFWGGLTGSQDNNKSVTPTPERKQNFDGAVRFTGTQFVISNNDKFDCENARLQINGGDYSLNGYLLEAGHQYTVGAAQFTKDDGTRFEPFSTKPLNFYIGCRGNNELDHAYWYGEF